LATSRSPARRVNRQLGGLIGQAPIAAIRRLNKADIRHKARLSRAFLLRGRIVSLRVDNPRVILSSVFLRGAFLLHRKQYALAHARNHLAAPCRSHSLPLAIRMWRAGVTLQKQSRKTSLR
jgi:hypothetical protein